MGQPEDISAAVADAISWDLSLNTAGQAWCPVAHHLDCQALMLFVENVLHMWNLILINDKNG